LGRVDLFQQLADIFFANTQATHNAQTHWRRHDAKDFSGTIEGGVVFFKSVELNGFVAFRFHGLKYSLKPAF
jgi:hypothetical protein